MRQIPTPNSPYSPDRHTRLRTALAVLLLLLLAASLIPVLLEGRYARASADDYSYGFYTHYAVQNGQCLLPAIWRMVWGNWRTWQGSFSAMALMTLTPCIFSERLYWLTPVVMLASLLLGTFKLSRTLVCRCAGRGLAGLGLRRRPPAAPVHPVHPVAPQQLLLVERRVLLHLHLRRGPALSGRLCQRAPVAGAAAMEAAPRAALRDLRGGQQLCLRAALPADGGPASAGLPLAPAGPGEGQPPSFSAWRRPSCSASRRRETTSGSPACPPCRRCRRWPRLCSRPPGTGFTG